ncbi:hypothetical protein [Kordia sp.]|uniref:hypothetical protein n=1 Tax=Kordia sp. TaxID=1965332 RepID=UPI003D26EEA8
MKNDKLDIVYFKIYASGLYLTFFFAFFKLYLISTDEYFDWSRKTLENFQTSPYDLIITSSLLIIPTGFILILFFYAKQKLKKADSNKDNLRIFYKEYIQLEGYIQTLIGFFIAILSLVPIANSDTTPEFGLVAFPIGMSLVTSIMGWYFGSDIAPPINSHKITETLDLLNFTTKKLNDDIKLLSIEILDTKNKYENTTQTFVTNINGLLKNQQDSIIEYNKTLILLKATNADYKNQVVNTLEDIKKSLLNHKDMYLESLKSLTKSTQEIQNKSQSDQLSQFKKFTENLEEELKKSNNDLNTYFENLLNYNELIISNSKETIDLIRTIENGLDNIKRTIREELFKNK